MKMNLLENIKKNLRQRTKLAVIVPAIALIILGIVYLFRILPYESTDDAFIEGHIITISSRVNGFVNSVDINDNQWVEEGDLLVQLDPRDYQAIVDLKQAALAAAHATAQQSLAGVKAATVESRRAETDYNRYKQIYDANGGITRQMLDNASSAAQAMTAQVEESIKNAAAEEAKIAQARADAALAMLNLSYSKIYAPQRGKVTNKTVEIGEYVSVGQPLMSIVPEKVWIIANFKETQLEYMKPGQSVKIKIDAYPQRIFKGHIDSIQAGTGAVFSLLPAENATGNYIKVVQRVPVKIVFDEDPNATSILSPGMSVLPEVKVK